MGAASDLTEASWQVFSRLLDEALELPADQRLAWLDRLDAEHEGLKPVLRTVIERSARTEGRQWLATVPRSDEATESEQDPALVAGALVGPYRLLRELGSGGMGAVWLAERADGSLKRQVALKLPRTLWSGGLAERMARERDILAGLEHPNIARLYDAGTDARGRPYLALEYVEGQAIDAYCRERALGVEARLQLLLQVAQAVAFAHSRLVIHRDLKPSNILVTGDGQVRLLDFGIAKLMEGKLAQETQLTRVAGRALTPDYASPEQIRGEPIGTASDVYSLGVVAYELLAGAKPYRLKRSSAAELEETIATVDAPLASATASDPAARKALRGDLDAVLNKALKKRPAERYDTVEAFAADLRRSLEGRRVEARADTLRYRVSRLLRRHRVPLLAGAGTAVAFSVAVGLGATALVMLALAAGLGVALWQVRVAKRQRDRALRLVDRQEAVLGFMNTLVVDAARGGEAFTAAQLLQRCEALVGPELGADSEAHAFLLSMLSTAMQTLGNPGEAIRLGERALALVDASTDPDVRDRVLINQALAIGWSGRYEEACGTLERVLARRDLPSMERAEAHHYLGMLANGLNDGPRAARHAEAALAALRSARRPNAKFEASILSNLGMALSAQGRMVEAEAHLSTAYRRLQDLGHGATVNAVTLLNNWAVLNDRAGDARSAQELAEQALSLAGADGRSAFVIMNRARAVEAQGRLDEAQAAYVEAERVATEGKAVPALVAARAGQASVFSERGELARAAAVLARANDAAAALPPAHPQRVTLRYLAGRLALAGADVTAARLAFDEVIAQAPEQAIAVMARLGVAQLELVRGEPDAALAAAETAKAQAMRLQGGKPVSFRTGLAGLTKARTLAAAGRASEARLEAKQAAATLALTVDAGHPALAEAARLSAAD
jgi:serine/threonine-protein kinase